MSQGAPTRREGQPEQAGPGTVQLDKCVKWYGQVIALNDVSVTIGPGVTGLLGPNGAGKSTFLKLCTGQLGPSKGSVRIGGEDVGDHQGLFRRVGFSPEQDSFYEWMNGVEFVSSLLRLNGYSASQAARAAGEAIDLVGLDEEARRKKIRAYSKGMRQRIKLAQAVAHNPQVLFLDEPLGGLDPLGRHLFISLIKEWGRNGRTVIVSSHILHEVEAMTRSIVLIHNGRILAEGDVHKIRELIDRHPHHIRVSCSDPRMLASRLVAFEDVSDIRFDSNNKTVSFETVRPEAFYVRLPKVALEAGISVEEIFSPDDNLEAVFKYLTE